MHATASFIGGLLGGLVAIIVLAIVCDRLLGQRLVDPVRRQMAGLLAAWVIAGVLGGFGFARDGWFTPRAFLLYLPPALLAAPLLYLRARGRRERPR